MQNSSCTAGRKWAYGTTSTVRMSSWSELRAEVLRRPRRARTSAADGRRQQQQVVAHVHDILLALLRDVARPAATRVREVGRGARAAAARRRGREVMSALAGRRGSGRRAGVARLGCSATRFERATVEAKSSKQRVRRLHCGSSGASFWSRASRVHSRSRATHTRQRSAPFRAFCPRNFVQ